MRTGHHVTTPSGRAKTRRVLGTSTAIAILLLGPLAGVASAHVGITADDATQGGYTKLTFRVPTEKDVPTIKVEVAMPTDTPIASVRFQPKDGWAYTVTKAAPATPLSNDDGAVTEIVTRIVWTATGDGVKPGEFDEFNVSAGPLPKTDQVVFKVLQTYSDASVVSWIEEQAAGAPEPDYPAPVLKLAPASAEGGAAAGSSVIATIATAPATTTGTAAIATDSTPIMLAVIALVLGVLSLVGVGYVLVRGRKASD